jgi:hypothetical protein
LRPISKTNKKTKRSQNVAQEIEHLPGKCEELEYCQKNPENNKNKTHKNKTGISGLLLQRLILEEMIFLVPHILVGGQCSPKGGTLI